MTFVPTTGSNSGNDMTGMVMQMQQDIASLQRYLQFNNSVDSGWLTIETFYNSFVGGTGVQTPQIRSVGPIVFARGVVYGGTAGDVAFYLPASFMPSVAVVLAVQEFGASADSWLTINGSGDSAPGAVTPATSGAWLCASWIMG